METITGKKPPYSGGGYAGLRVFLGGVLLVAAALKGYQLATEPTAEIDLMTSRWFLVAVVECEVLLGLCLLSGMFVRASWLIALGCFALFACVSFYMSLSGNASCRCFGSVHVNPWYTLGLDVAAVVALLRWRSVLSKATEPVGESRPASHYVALVGLWLVVGLSAGWCMTRSEVVTMNAEGDFIGNGEIVLLEPETWVGTRFPLLEHIDVGARLAAGRWVVLLYHHDCPQCQALLPEYKRLAQDRPEQAVALVEVPPFGRESVGGLTEAAAIGRLMDTKDWFVQAPAEIRLSNGNVTAIRGAEELENAWGGREQ